LANGAVEAEGKSVNEGEDNAIEDYEGDEPETPGHVEDNMDNEGISAGANGGSTKKVAADGPDEMPDTVEKAPPVPASSTRPTTMSSHTRHRSLAAPSTSLSNGATTPSTDTEARLDELVKDRAALKDEVTQLRKSLQEIQETHEEEMKSQREQLEEATAEKTHAEEQYQNLLGRVNAIRSQLGERLKADAVGFITPRGCERIY
jgi:hypothetical protein